ncbi:MAG TPA: phospholipid carrier-dependent glycosyltransferase, partial [Thermoanaerobaculia bacterium]|nr:phospholipid carrier-dependent glycosyltransferase [Thermoanaerobaculia bacterium]
AGFVILLLPLAKAAADSFYLAPGQSSFDDLSYHLTAVATWHRHGDLRMVKFSMGDSGTAFYPILSEISAWALLAPFRDSDVAARWVELPFALFSLVALAAVARRLGLSPRAAAFAVLLYASIRRFFPVLALGAGNDHAAAFFTLAALDGILETAWKPRPGSAASTGLALGLLVGTKYIGVLNAATLLALLALLVLVRRPRLAGTALAGLVALLAVTMAIAGGYTYLRNAVTAGNPLFPAPLLGLPGWEGATMAFRSQFPEYRIDVPRFLTARPDLFGPLFPFTLLPAALLAPFLALRKGPWTQRIETALVFALPAVFFLEFLYLMHDHRDVRYFASGIALAAVAFAWLTERIGPRAGVAIRALVLLAATASVLARAFSPGKIFLGTLLVVAAALVATRWRPVRLPGLRWAGIAGLALLLIAMFPAGAAVAKYQRVKLRDQTAAYTLEELAGPSGARIAYAGWNQPYLFFGSRLQNDVQYVPSTPSLAHQHYTWGGSPDVPLRSAGRYRTWRQNLERQKIDYVVLFRSRWENPERRWIVRHPEAFRLVYEDSQTEIWEVRSPTAVTGVL